uniref:Uncharacterized protein n=1 Tax=Phaeodactylum tricornutum TaxID=2850 RepID=A0A8J9X2Q4_PHATR
MTETPHSEDCPSPRSHGLHIFPIRNRLFTEETVPVRNHAAACFTMTHENPFKSPREVTDVLEADAVSHVSSLSSDSRRRNNSRWNGVDMTGETGTGALLLPHEIAFFTPRTPSPEWLAGDERDNGEGFTLMMPPPPSHKVPTTTVRPSPSLPRPILGKFRSTPIFPHPSSISPIFEGRIRTSVADQSLISQVTEDDTLSLLGNRPRRRPVRGSSSAISVGSIVGQSSLKTVPTLATVSISEQSFTHQIKAQQTLDSLVAERSPMRHGLVKRELHYMFKSVSSPLRRFQQSRQKVDLQRTNKGCLT